MQSIPLEGNNHGIYPLAELELTSMVQLIYSKLHSLPSLRHVTMRALSTSLVVSLLQVPCQSVTTLDIEQPGQDATTQDILDLATCIQSHSWLRELTLTGYSKVALTTILGPSMTSLTQLTNLCVRGQHDSPWRIATLAEARIVTGLVTMPSLEELELDHVLCESDLATLVFCRGLAESGLQKLRISGGVRFPIDSHALVARTLVKSQLIELVFAAPASLEFLVVFRHALLESETSVLERLSFQTSPNVLAFFCLEQIGDRPIYRRLDATWTAPVQRTLHLNQQRRTSPPLFAAIQNATTERDRRWRMVEALDTVDMPIVYEYFCRNEGSLREVVKDALSNEQPG